MGLVKEINHVNVKEMETWEMDAGFSLALGLPTRKTLVDGRPCAEVAFHLPSTSDLARSFSSKISDSINFMAHLPYDYVI